MEILLCHTGQGKVLWDVCMYEYGVESGHWFEVLQDLQQTKLTRVVASSQSTLGERVASVFDGVRCRFAKRLLVAKFWRRFME